MSAPSRSTSSSLKSRPSQSPSLTWVRLVLRHLRGSAGRWLALAAVVAVTSGLIMAWPRWLEATTTAELQHDLDQRTAAFVDPVAAPSSLWIYTDTIATTLEAADEAAWVHVNEALEDLRARQPEPLRSRLGEPFSFQTFSPIATPDAAVTDRTFLGIAPTFAPQLLDHVTFVEGRPPTYEPYTAAHAELWVLDPENPVPLPAVEIALSTDSARELRWEVGTSRDAGSSFGVLPFLLTGTFEATDPGDGYWGQASGLVHPTVFYTPDQNVMVTARAFVVPGGGSLPVNFAAAPEGNRLWFPLDLDGVTGVDAQPLATQLRELSSKGASVQLTALTFATEAPGVIEATLGRRSATQSVLTLAVAAPAGVLLALLALASQVIVAPRRGQLELLALRGARTGQLRLLLAIEAAVVSVPAAVLGALGAVALLPDHAGAAWWAAPAVVAAAPVLALAIEGGRAAAGNRGASARRTGRLRLASEVLLVILAVASLVLVLRRGVGAAGSEALTSAVSLLLALVVAVGCARLLPLVLGPLARRLQRGPGLVAGLGASMATRRAAPIVAVAAIVTGTAVAVLGQVTVTTVSTSLRTAALTSVGADIRITGRLDPVALADLAELDGVRDLAAVIAPPGGSALTGTELDMRANVFAVDPERLASVQRDVPGALSVPSVDDDGGPTPVIVAESLKAADGAAGDLVLTFRVPVVVDSSAAAAPGLTATQNWVVIDAAALAAVGVELPVTSTLIALEPGADPVAVAAAVRERVGELPTVTTFSERTAALIEAPTAHAMRTGLAVVAVLGLGCAVAAVLLTLAGAALSRTRLIAVLRTLGLPPRAELRLVLWEIAPAAALSLVAGTALGLALSHLVVRVADLRPFTGSVEPPPIVVDPVWLVGTLLGVLVVVGLAVAGAALAAGRRSAAVVLRVGEGSS